MGISLPINFERNIHRHLTLAMNALKKSLGTLVALITVVVCLSGIQGFAVDFSGVMKSARKDAEQGDAEAQYFLRRCHADGGMGVTQDYAEAAKWYRLAAEQGDAFAQLSLGDCYANGDGVPKDDLPFNAGTTFYNPLYICRTRRAQN